MIAVAFTFTALGFHATRWGHHVNEGGPEWPPSPWRILRALASAWLRTMPEVAHDPAVKLLEELAAEQPHYYLPPAALGHTRHFMPYYESRTSIRERRAMVIDSFVVPAPRQSVVVFWPHGTLQQEERQLLGRLLDNLGYLGRAESWCDARLIESPPDANCTPLDTGAIPSRNEEIVPVLVPRPGIRLKDLLAETDDLRAQGRVDPPGAQWAKYIRPADCFGVRQPAARADTRARPTVLRYALTGRVAPLVTDTLRIADLARSCGMARYGRLTGGSASQTLSGKDPDGKPLRGHRHAFYLPTDEDGDGHIDHLTIWAPAGFEPVEFVALTRLRTLNPGGDGPEVRLALLGQGSTEDFQKGVSILSASTAWRSYTPFWLNRHPKWRGPGGQKRVVDGPADQLKRELTHRAEIGTTVTLVEAASPPTLHSWRAIHPFEYHRWRRGEAPAGGGFYFRVRFVQPVAGPIALGYGCHFGLGLFVPDVATEPAVE